MRFEKWQALGNDYLIVEAGALSFPLTADRVRKLCDRHQGVGADGVLELSPPGEPGYVARLRIFNPDGSEAELSGNGAREAVLYLRRAGWTGETTFSILTVAGEIRASVTGATTCLVDMGDAKLRSPDYPGGATGGRGELEAGGRRWAFQHVSVGNPQCAIQVSGRDELEALDLPAIGPAIERSPLFPQRTNVSFWTELSPGEIRARMFERGVGETLASGTGACGAAVDAVLRGGASPITVRLDGGTLEVQVDADLHVDLTGWAVPVFRGELTEELLAALADEEPGR